jgi:DNA-directed RNA polymerase subunit RPC12/RpoP
MWFRNYYRCARCKHEWTDEWSATCDDDCPKCGARHMSPHKSDDLTIIVVPRDTGFVVLCSPDTAEHNPDYRELAKFANQRAVEDFANSAPGTWLTGMK